VPRAQDRDRMLQLVRAWEASGESRRRFAARYGLTLWQLDYWKRRARATPVRPTVAFAPVQVVDAVAPRSGAGLEPQLASGDRLFIPADASPDLVRAVARRCGRRADDLARGPHLRRDRPH
jgi:hypothetical protein